MKNIVTILALILCTFTLHAQFRMVGSAAAPGWSVVSATDYRANIIFGPDATGQGYTALLITDDFRLFTQTGQLYDIVSIDVPAGFSSIGITVREREGNWGIPSGVLQVYDPGNRRKIPACPVAGNGSNNQLLAAIISYNSNQSGGSGAEVLYVDKANYTGNPVIGDPSQPFETPWQASDYAQAGDVIEILSGNYIIVDSATYLTHPAYDVLVTSEDQYAYNLMKTDQLTYRFRSGTSIQFSAQEGYLAYDTLGYSMTIEGDWTLYTTEDNGVPFNVQGTNTAQTGTLKVEVSKMIDTRDHTLAVYDTSPRVFYLQNLQRFELKCDYITGSHRLLAWDGELSVQETYVDIGYWSQLYTDYPFLIQADTLRDQSHYIKIQNLDIPDFDFVFIEINRAYYWENTNFTFDIENAQVDRLTKATTTQGASDSEALKYSWIGGSFWTTANTLINSNITLDIENCYGNVPILNMTHAPDAITIDNFNYRIKGNWYYNTDYTNSTSTQGLFDIRDFFLPVDGVTIYMDGNFISLDTVPLIKFKTPDMVLKGTFKTQGDVPVIDIQTNATGQLDLIDAHLYNDGTVAEIQSSVPYNVNVDGSWNSPNLDPDVTINRYPIGGDMVQNLQTNGNWISGDGGNEGIAVDGAGKIGVGTLMPSYILDINSTDAVRLPVGTTAQRPTGANGLLRYNSDLSRLEGYYNAEWNGLSSTLADISSNSTTTAKSLYSMTSGQNVEFRRSAGTPLLYLNESTGRVGVGISPTDKFTVATSAGDNIIAAYDYSDNSGHTNYWFSRRSKSNTLGTLVTTNINDYLGVFYFQGVNASNQWAHGAKIVAQQDGSAGTFVPSKIVLQTYSSTGENSNQLHLGSNGNVGIGVVSSVAAALRIQAGTTSLAPVSLTSGALLTTPLAGAMEWDGTNLYITQTTGPTRKTIAYTTDILSIQEITPATSTTITIDQQSKINAITVVDMTTASTGSTITLSMSNTAPGVITIDFENTTSGMEIDFPAGFLDQTGAAWDGGSTYSVTGDFFMTCYSTDGTTWKCK